MAKYQKFCSFYLELESNLYALEGEAALVLKIIGVFLSSPVRRMHLPFLCQPNSMHTSDGGTVDGPLHGSGGGGRTQDDLLCALLLRFPPLLSWAGAVSSPIIPNPFPLERLLLFSQLPRKAEWTRLCITSWRWLFNLRWVPHYSSLRAPLIHHHVLLLSLCSTYISAPNASLSCCLLDAVGDYLLEKADGYLV